MSVRMLSAVWSDQTITNQSDLLVLLAIADFANDTGHAWPSIESIALKSRHSDRGVQKIIIRLETLGKLKVRRGGGPKGSTSLYQISPPNPVHPTPEPGSPRMSSGSPVGVNVETPRGEPGGHWRSPNPSGSVNVPVIVPVSRVNEEVKHQILILQKQLNVHYKRHENTRWSNLDETSLADVASRHPDILSEWAEIEAYTKRMDDPKYFPASAGSLLEKWDATLDRARKPDTGQKFDLRQAQASLESTVKLIDGHPANRSSVCYKTSHTPEQRAEYDGLKVRRRELERRIALA